MKMIPTFGYNGMPMYLNADRIVAISQTEKMNGNQRLTEVEMACWDTTVTWHVCEPCADLLAKCREA